MTSILSRRIAALACSALAMIAAPIAAASAQAASLDGAWRSVGYGYALTITGESLQSYEVTAISCVRTFRAHRSGPADASGTTFTIDSTPQSFILTPGSRADERRMHRNGAASDI